MDVLWNIMHLIEIISCVTTHFILEKKRGILLFHVAPIWLYSIVKTKNILWFRILTLYYMASLWITIVNTLQWGIYGKIHCCLCGGDTKMFSSVSSRQIQFLSKSRIIVMLIMLTKLNAKSCKFVMCAVFLFNITYIHIQSFSV
jgi:hypothetical protein